MADPTIPFGPDTDPLGLSATDFEFISLDGPQTKLDNEKMSMKKDGKFLRWCATRKVTTYTANYQILNAAATKPAVGLRSGGSGTGVEDAVWVREVNTSKPQEGDQTMAVVFAVPGDVAAPEALDDDFGLGGSSV